MDDLYEGSRKIVGLFQKALIDARKPNRQETNHYRHRGACRGGGTGCFRTQKKFQTKKMAYEKQRKRTENQGGTGC